MPAFKIKNEDLIIDILGEIKDFPKYTTQILNLANQNAQGTRPKIVGQLSDLIQEFKGQSFEGWKEWYLAKNPNAIDNATYKVSEMIENLKKAILLIDKDMIKKWVEDLVIAKTFTGLKFQGSILKKIANLKSQSFRLANPKEESQGIDGFIGDIPISIKPTSYKTKNMLSEQISVSIVFYEKVKDGIKIAFDF